MTNAAAEHELRELLARSEQLGDQLRSMAAELSGFVERLAARENEESGGTADAS